MNANDNDRAKRLDEYIDALNAGKPAPPVKDDAELAALFATARDFHRLRAAEAVRDDVPSRLAAALARELRADQTRETRRIESNDMSQYRDASSNGAIRPPSSDAAPYAIPHRPERGRQFLQFVAAIAAFLIVGVILTQVLGGQNGGSPDGAVGTDPGGTPTEQTESASDLTTPTHEATPESSSTTPEPTATLGAATPEATQEVIGGGEPTATPNPDIPIMAVLSLSLDYVTCEDTVIAYGINFEPDSTVTIYGGQLIGNNFAPVVDEHAVDSDGRFEVELNLSRMISECGGGDAQREGSQFRLSASTGSALSKDGIDADGPTAMTVLTFSRDVPESVKLRPPYQYCGVEVMLNESMLGEASEPDILARECFIQAARIGGYAAEFVSHQQTIEGDIVTYIYRSDGTGNVELFVDSTRDQFGSSAWTVTTCSGASYGDEMSGWDIELSGCGEAEPIT